MGRRSRSGSFYAVREIAQSKDQRGRHENSTHCIISRIMKRLSSRGDKCCNMEEHMARLTRQLQDLNQAYSVNVRFIFAISKHQKIQEVSTHSLRASPAALVNFHFLPWSPTAKRVIFLTGSLCCGTD